MTFSVPIYRQNVRNNINAMAHSTFSRNLFIARNLSNRTAVLFRVLRVEVESVDLPVHRPTSTRGFP